MSFSLFIRDASELIEKYDTKYNTVGLPFGVYTAETYDAVYIIADGLRKYGEDTDKIKENAGSVSCSASDLRLSVFICGCLSDFFAVIRGSSAFDRRQEINPRFAGTPVGGAVRPRCNLPAGQSGRAFGSCRSRRRDARTPAA